MGATIGELDQRQMERLRAEIAEAMAASFAYPPFFSHASGREVVRPIDRAKRDELEQFVRSANLSQLDHSDASSPEVRRFLERLMSRYLDVNSALQRPWSARRVAALRSRVPKVAAEVHRSLLADLAGGATGFGARRQQRSWLGAGGRRPADGAERNTQVLAAILTRGESGPPAPPASPQSRPGPYGAPAAASSPATDGRTESTGSTDWLANANDATIPVPAHLLNGGGGQSSPFASFATGAQSSIFGGATSIADRPTGPLPAPSGAPPAPASQPAPSRNLSDDLYQLYGDYLRDMHPELAAAPAPPPPSPVAAPPRPLPQPAPASPPSSAYTAAAPASADTQIFFQLRYQLEAFVRRAARSYGVRGRTDEPTSVLDALRRSGFVDESDLRLAESILAITDKVISSGVAGMDDFRQALMLYLLYHRSHLGS